jgi:streptogramin lyase
MIETDQTAKCRRSVGWALVALAIGACASPASGGTMDGLGRIAVELTVAPADARCLRITVAGTGSTVTRELALSPGGAVAFDLTGLPLGMVTVTEEAFTVACPVPANTSPTWIADPVPATLIRDMPVEVMVAFRRADDTTGQLVTHATFPDPPMPFEEIPVGCQSFGIAPGPDGAVWFVAPSGKIDRIDAMGTVTRFTTALEPRAIVTGADGNLWMTDDSTAQLLRMRANDSLPNAAFPIPSELGTAGAIAAGRDGALWFTLPASNHIGRMTTDGELTRFPIPAPDDLGTSDLVSIAAGPDDNLWFTESATNKIGRLTPGGGLTEFPIPSADSSPQQIVAGADGNLWFVERATGKIGKVALDGSITELPATKPANALIGIASGPDGNLWFTEGSAHAIGRITPDGTVTELPIPSGTDPSAIASGPDGNVWFTEPSTFSIGRIRP